MALEVGETVLELTPDQADALAEDLTDALTARETFLHTDGVHRADGSYVVERRGADSAGNAKVFPSFDVLVRLADRLPETVTADDLSHAGLTAGRRHMVLWHLVEHPSFPFDLASRQPLTAERTREA